LLSDANELRGDLRIAKSLDQGGHTATSLQTIFKMSDKFCGDFQFFGG
jgi:hypothetical protein